MGTLFNQSPRNYREYNENEIQEFLETILKLSQKYKIPTNEVIHAVEVLEIRRKNDLYVANGDIFDEQMAGLGNLLQDLNNKILSDRLNQ
ncbi:MAG: hypothetical protein WCP16_03225 [Pseudanabaena sp. ELA645]|jgi:hypothetical protein